jgi:RNA polymerase sigma-70 factor (ECF subfamily)
MAKANNRMETFTVAMVITPSEAELITQAQSGERNAFSELVCIHAQGVRNVIYHMCGDTQIAEDAAQETFIQAWKHLPSYRPQTSLRNWLYRIAVNAATDLLRKEKHILPNALEDLQLQDPHLGPEALFFEGERTALIQNAILSLPDVSRAVLVLREYEGMSYHEIANALDIPIGTVMSRLNYARKALKDKLQQSLFVQVEVKHVDSRE